MMVYILIDATSNVYIQFYKSEHQVYWIYVLYMNIEWNEK